LRDDLNIVIERDIEMSTRDGIVLRGDLYRPSAGRHPTLIMRTPYGKDVPMGLMVVLDPLRAAAAGYCVFIQDVRGRFKSDGDFVPLVNEAKDGFDAVEWAAAQPWSNGRVGMYGSSYMASTQLQAATEAPPHLQAICPMEGSADYYEGRTYKGGAFELGAMLSIALFALGAGNIRRKETTAVGFRSAWRNSKAMLDDLPSVAATAPLIDLKHTLIGDYAPFFFDWLEHDQPGAYWDSFSVEPKHHMIKVPALHLTSWYDPFAVGAITNYLGIQANGADKLARANQYLWIGPWGHYMPRTVLNGAARLGEVEFGLNALVDLDAIQISWFDKWLKDDTSLWRFKTAVRLFVMGDNVWRGEAAWPLLATERPLFLAASGALTSTPPSHSSPDAYRSDPADPVPTIGGAHVMLESAFAQGPWDQRLAEARSDVLIYTSSEFTEDVEIIGDVKLEVYLSSTAPSVDVVGVLTVVRADGASINVVDGIRRVTLVPGEVAKVQVSLGPVAQTFKRGERIRLRLAGSNFPRHDLNPQTGARSCTADRRVVADQLIYHDIVHPSTLYLPVVRGVLP
jgi:putative CocE/NonD family hydrolase